MGLLQCSRCGDVGHSPTLCPFKGAKCGKIGHIKRACHSRKSRPQESRSQRNSKSIGEVLTEEQISAVLTEKEDSDLPQLMNMHSTK